MAFSFYQSLRTVPRDLDEVARGFRLTGWQKFWQLEAPFAVPGLIWNTMMSMSGGWFFVVASEAITVGDTTVTLPGVGSYIAAATTTRAMGRDPRRGRRRWARHPALRSAAVPADHRLGGQVPRRTVGRREVDAPGCSTCRSAPTGSAALSRPLFAALRSVAFVAARLAALSRGALAPEPAPRASSTRSGSWSSSPARSGRSGGRRLCRAPSWAGATWGDVSCSTFVHAAARHGADGAGDAIWVPISVWIGLQAALAERSSRSRSSSPPSRSTSCSARRSADRPFHLNPDIWLSVLIVFGTQWYILFNVIAGASAFPNDLREAATNFRVNGWVWWRQVILPGDRALLFHRRDHRLGRLVERLDRRRIRQMEGPDGRGARRRRLYRRGDRQGRLPQASCSASRSCRSSSPCSTVCSGAGSTPTPNGGCACNPRLRRTTPCSTPPPPSLLDVSHVSQTYPKGSGETGAPVLQDVSLSLQVGRDRRPARPLRLRQVDAAAHHLRADAADRGQPSLSTASRSTARPKASRWCSRASRCSPG